MNESNFEFQSSKNSISDFHFHFNDWLRDKKRLTSNNTWQVKISAKSLAYETDTTSARRINCHQKFEFEILINFSNRMFKSDHYSNWLFESWNRSEFKENMSNFHSESNRTAILYENCLLGHCTWWVLVVGRMKRHEQVSRNSLNANPSGRKVWHGQHVC